jgi:hypothetical protein
VSCGLDHEQRRAALTAAHGPAAPVPAGPALQLIGRRWQVHPRDVVAYSYRDQQAADAWGASTAEHFGIPPLGTAPADGAVIGVYDLRPVLAEHGVAATDPARPDLWHPPADPVAMARRGRRG